MRSAQLRVRQLVTVVSVILFLVVGAIGSLPRPSAALGVGRTVVGQTQVNHPPFGRRWF